MASEALERVQRWTAKRRTALVLQILKGETSAQEASREQELTVGEVEGWVEKGLAAIENQLRSRPHDEEALKDEEVGRLKQEIGELVLDNEILREAAKPYGREDVGREKGVLPHASERRICRVLEVPRSSLSPERRRRPAKPLRDDLLAARIQRIVERPPAFGYRRIWALLRFREKGFESTARRSTGCSGSRAGSGISAR